MRLVNHKLQKFLPHANVALQEAVKRAGSLRRLSQLLGIKHQAIYNWQRTGVPPGRVLDIERLTGIARHRLRPDIYPPEEY